MRTGNSERKREINQKKARGTEQMVSLCLGLNLEMRRTFLN